MIPQAPYLKVKKRLPLKQSDDLVRKIFGVVKKGIVTFQRLISCFIQLPLAPALPPLGAGAHAIHLYYH